ncbi:MAG: histidinol-phosphate aminotransferase family protein [Chitinophagaceae bacterium]|nr:histidinol-phosphate aminotransferase family protein [Chitinophagaceae bacterium]
MSINRRDWLRQSSLAALTLGFSLPSMGNEEGITRNFGMDSGLINLGSNENPYGMSPKARAALIDMLSEHNRYQFNVKAFDDYPSKIGAYYGVGGNNIIITAGSGDALAQLARHYNKGSLVTATPTFATLPNTAKRLGTKVIEIPLTAEKTHDLPAMLRAIDSNTQTVYICNPANPSSTILSPAALKDFCMEASKKATVIIDEAYIDFLNPPDNVSMIGLAANNRNIIVVRTFSKIHGMAGMRIGFLVTHPDTMNALDRTYFGNTQMSVSNLTLAAALASLKDEEHRQMCKDKNAAARSYTIGALQNLGYKPINSYTNFVFFPLGNYAGNFSDDMLKKKVLIRSNTYPDGKWGRVSVGTMEEMKQFIGLMKA